MRLRHISADTLEKLEGDLELIKVPFELFDIQKHGNNYTAFLLMGPQTELFKEQDVIETSKKRIKK